MGNVLEQYLIRKAVENRVPISGTLELTPLCNLNCKMCYIRHTKEEVDLQGGLRSLKFWLNLIPQMQTAGVLFLNLIGGEIFTYPQIDKLYTELCKSGFQVAFTTNGTMLAHVIPKWLFEYRPRYVTLSIYGASNETYEKVCGIQKGFDQVCQALERLIENKFDVKLNYCVTPENVQDMEKVFQFAKWYGLRIDASAYNYPPTRKNNSNCSNQRFNAGEVAALELNIKKFKRSKNEYAEFVSFLAKEKFSLESSKAIEHFWCNAGRTSFWINWKGEMTPCGMLENPAVNLQEVKFNSAWKEIYEKVESIIVSPACAKCDKREICQCCPAMVYAESHNFGQKPEYICNITESMIEFAKKTLQE